MPIANMMNKEQVARILSNIRVNVELDVDYLYDVYEMSNEVIEMLNQQNSQIEVKDINQFDLLLYCVGEYY